MSDVRRPLVVRVLVVAVVVVGVAFAATTLPGLGGLRPPGFWTPVDGWLQGVGYVLLGLLALTRPLLVERDRGLWGLVAAAVVARSLAFLLFFTVVRTQQPQPYPSVSDGFWITSSLLLVAALLLRARHGTAPALSRLLALDGLVGALATAGLGVAVLQPVLAASVAPSTPPSAITVNLAYPLLDVVTLVVVAALVASGCRAERPDLVLLAGIVLSAAVDVLYLLMLADGTWRPGTPVSALGFLGTALVCLAPWSARSQLGPRPAPEEPARPEATTRSITAPGVAWTAVLAVVCLVGLVVVEVTTRASIAVLLLLTLGVVVALVRGMLTLREGQQEADALLGSSAVERERFAALVEASTDFVAIADLEGSLLYLNPAGRTMIGLGADADVRGMGPADLRPPEVLQRTREYGMPTLRREGHVEDVTLLARQDGGTSVPVVSHSFVMRSPRTGRAFALGTIQRDVTAANAAAAELQRLAEERQRLLTRLVQAQDDERARIAADVHDDSVQALAAVQLRLGLLQRQLEDRLEPDQLDAIGTVQDTVAAATARLRHLLFDLESPARRTDLVSALEEAASYVLDEVGVSFSVTGEAPGDLPEATRVTAYRVAKEALVNVRKHAGARHVHVEVARDAAGLTVCVVDDGRGIAPGEDVARPGHLGLASMRDRAAVAGGRLQVEPGPEGGTRLRVWLPVAAPRGESAPSDPPV